MNQHANSGIAGDSLYTHLNTTGDGKGILAAYGGVGFIYSLASNTSDMLIKILQDFFQAYALGREFNAGLAKVNKQVTIMDQFAADTQPLPQVVVTSMPADNMAISLGDKQGQQAFDDELYEVFGGQALINTTLELYDSGKPNVEKLADVIFLSLMYYVHMHMQIQYLTIDKPKIRFSNAVKITDTGLGGELYRINLTMPIITEWKQFMQIETVDVEKMQREITVTDGDTSLR